ncbi:MAG: UDP-N-acetylmuramoyl-tripeptide--D-alanyl-D-alanine ligase [bacterium]|nr:UDP-N-acetylmuramoyl-tripeptide--D-alanyl-D-alanine ligase [bacterium]
MAKSYIRRYKPMIVAITGNTGKTSTKEAIAAVLKEHKRIRVSAGNLNNEWGVPLNILGDWSGAYYEKGGTLGFWLGVIWKGFWGLGRQKNYPEILVLEYGAEKPGDIGKLVRDFKPHVAVITAVGEIPVHVEYFSSPEELAKEKRKLIETLTEKDWAVLNADDEMVSGMRTATKAQVATFGFAEGAHVRITNFDFKLGSTGEPLGVTFKLHQNESFVPVKIEGSLGKSQAWSAAAAAAVGLIFGINMVESSSDLALYKGLAGRLKILKGIRHSIIIDDTYNSSPASAHLALETLKGLTAKRKIVVLGDMLELGTYSEDAHRSLGNLAGTIADWIITVGSRAKFIADSAGNQLPKDRILSFNDSQEAKQKVQELIQEGDLILVKGSQGMRMEKVVEAVMADPDQKKHLLVRQSEKWLNKE